MAQPIVVSPAAELADGPLEDWGPVRYPLSHPPATVRGRSYPDLPRAFSVGIWQCSPGRWRRAVMQAEFAHFTGGRGWFHPDGGEPFEIRSGVSVWFPPNTTGVWIIAETLQKRFVVVDRRSIYLRALASLAARTGIGRLWAATRRRRSPELRGPVGVDALSGIGLRSSEPAGLAASVVDVCTATTREAAQDAHPRSGVEMSREGRVPGLQAVSEAVDRGRHAERN